MRTLVPGLLLLGFASFGCEDFGVPLPILPSVLSFTASPTGILEGEAVHFAVRAASDIGLARGIIDFGDGTKQDTLSLSGVRDSAHATHTYLTPGTFKPTLTLEDVAGQRIRAADTVYVRANQLPQIISRLTGLEGAVSHVPKSTLATDAEGDPLTLAVSPVSSGLVFQMNARGDSVIYFLADPDDNGTKQGMVTVVDQKNRRTEKVIDIAFSPLDDIRGRVRDRFEGTYLASYNPAVVMHGPYKGWVAAITGSGIVTVPVDPSGSYVLPKLPVAQHTLRAFLTNGVDSSFVATYQLPPGDHMFDVGVETNAGTDMPLGRLLSFYQIVNFRNRDGIGDPGWLSGIDLKYNAPHYIYYLMGKDTALYWLNTKGLTAEQQDWLEGEIQSRCFAHIPPAHRPRILKASRNDAVPLRTGSVDGYNVVLPSDGYVIIYANLQPLPNELFTLWDERRDGLYDGGRIGLNVGAVSTPPYGFSISTLVRSVEQSISGGGSVLDPYFNSRSVRAQYSVLTLPTIADMKLDWQVIFETPGNNYSVEAKYFTLPN